MNLAMNRRGQLGRKIRSMGEEAVIAPAACAERTTTVFVNPAQIQADNQYWGEVEQSVAALQAQADAEFQAHMAQIEADYLREAKNIEMYQADIPEDATDCAVKNFLAREIDTPESIRVAKSIGPDFSQTSQVPGERFVTPTHNYTTDFAMFKLVGNPLTRDGSYGVVTDYDRFVRGTEMTGAEIHTSNTMLGRGTARQARQIRQMGRMGSASGMGDWSMPDINWDAVTEAVMPAAQQSLVNLVAPSSSPQIITQQVPVAVSSGQSASMAQSGQIMGMPKAVVYGVVGLMALGVVFMGIKAVKA